MGVCYSNWGGGGGWGAVYIRPEMKSTRNEIQIHHKRNSVHITFHCGRWCLHDISSPEMKVPFCQNDGNKITHVTSFISGCMM